MNKNILSALAALSLVTGCGGGAGSATTPVTTTPVTSSTPTTTQITDPFIDTKTAGFPVSTLTGTAYRGASVTAYVVQPDGSNGAALGPAVIAEPIIGGFTLTMTSAPTGMVRLVATGGKRTSFDIDLTVQQGGTMELVTPYVTSVYNFFEITPVTHIASHVLAFKASHGAKLVDAFNTGMATALEMDVAFLPFLNDNKVYLNVLSGTVDGTSSRSIGIKSPTTAMLVKAVDWFGEEFDLPTNVVTRILAAAAENDYPLVTVDGSGKSINVGKWVGGVFDETVPFTMEDMLAANTTYAFPSKTVGGIVSHPKISDYVSRNLITDLVVDSDCKMHTSLQTSARYPYYAFDSSGAIFATDCVDTGKRVAALMVQAVSTNRYRLSH